jgi:hypothetical protein
MSTIVENWIKSRGLPTPKVDGSFTLEAQLLFAGEMDTLGVTRALAEDSMYHPESLPDSVYAKLLEESGTALPEVVPAILDEVPAEPEEVQSEASEVVSEDPPVEEDAEEEQEVPVAKLRKKVAK